MKSDASPPSPGSSVSFRVSSVVTQYEHHAHEEEDTKNVIEDSEPKGQVHDSIGAYKPKRYTEAGTIF